MQTARLNEELKSLKTAGNIYAAERQGWHKLKAERDGLFDFQCEKLTESANEAIRAHVRRYADAGKFVERLRESLSGSNVRRERIEALGETVATADNPEERWSRILDELETLAAFSPDQEGITVTQGLRGWYAGRKETDWGRRLIPDHKPGVSIGWILGQLLSSARRAQWPDELSGYTFKHLVDEGKISSYTDRAAGRFTLRRCQSTKRWKTIE
jgi:hypothetical protein